MMHLFVRTILALLILFMPHVAMAKATSWANGSWGWVRQDETNENKEFVACGLEAMRVEIDLDNDRYTSSYSNGAEDKAGILFSKGNFLTLQYDGEERLMENGEPHIWTMYFINQNEFVWVRADWVVEGQIKGSTSALRRCVDAIV